MSGKCPACNKTAYANEALNFNSAVFHKGCFKCQSCATKLDLRTAMKIGDQVLCKNCVERQKKEQGGKIAGFAAPPGAAAGSD